MSYLERFCLTLLIILVSLCLGVLAKRGADKNFFGLTPNFLDLTRKRVQETAIYCLFPFAAALSLWGLPKPSPELFALPLFGLLSYVWGGFLALRLAKFLKMTPAQTGAYYCCGAFTNIGAVGGLVCLLFLGEDSIAMVALYRLLEEAYYFGVAFPVARQYGPEYDGGGLRLSGFRPSAPLLGILLALLCGVCLNIGGVPRPAFLGTVAAAAMALATVFFLFAIGLTLRAASFWNYRVYSLWMCLVKFAAVPGMVTSLAWLTGYGTIENGLPLRVVAVLSSMPVAMTALVPPALFNLDVDLANACWLFTTAGLPVVLAALSFLLPML